MKTKTLKTILSFLLCAVVAFGAALPAFAAGQTEVKPTWQNAIESVTPIGDGPAVKIRLTPEGYKITECRLPENYKIALKDGTYASVSLAAEPDHFAPLNVYENFADVKTPDGTITLYMGVAFSSVGSKDLVFSVGQYVLDGTLGEDGQPAAGSEVYEFSIFEEKCESEIDEGNFIVRILYRLYTLWQKIENWFKYTLWQKIENWFVLHFHKK